MSYGRQLALVPDPIEVDWRAFHRTHPEVLEQLIVLARKWKAAGHQRIGIATLFEVLRYERGLQSKDEYGFKLNNSYRALYARHIMATCSDLDGIFETRTLRSSHYEEAS